jgi:hypothetical protein
MRYIYSLLLLSLVQIGCRKDDFDSGADGMKITLTVDGQSKSYIWPNVACYNTKKNSWDEDLPIEGLDFQDVNLSSIQYLTINFRPKIQVRTYNTKGLEVSNYTDDWPSSNDIQMTLGTYFNSPILPTNFSSIGVCFFYPKNGTLTITSNSGNKISFNSASNWSQEDYDGTMHNMSLKIEARNIRLE